MVDKIWTIMQKLEKRFVRGVELEYQMIVQYVCIVDLESDDQNGSMPMAKPIPIVTAQNTHSGFTVQ